MFYTLCNTVNKCIFFPSKIMFERERKKRKTTKLDSAMGIWQDKEYKSEKKIREKKSETKCNRLFTFFWMWSVWCSMFKLCSVYHCVQCILGFISTYSKYIKREFVTSRIRKNKKKECRAIEICNPNRPKKSVSITIQNHQRLNACVIPWICHESTEPGCYFFCLFVWFLIRLSKFSLTLRSLVQQRKLYKFIKYIKIRTQREIYSNGIFKQRIHITHRNYDRQ